MAETENIQQENKKKGLLIVLLLLIAAAAIGIAIWAVCFRKPAVVLAPDYAPRRETNAEAIEGDEEEKMEQPEGGGAVSLTYSDKVTVSLSDGMATLMFANPGKSNQNMVLQIVIQDQVILQSGAIEPGNQVTELELLPDAGQMLEPGGYDGTFTIYYYDPDSGEKALVNTEIPIQITVEP